MWQYFSMATNENRSWLIKYVKSNRKSAVNAKICSVVKYKYFHINEKVALNFAGGVEAIKLRIILLRITDEFIKPQYTTNLTEQFRGHVRYCIGA